MTTTMTRPLLTVDEAIDRAGGRPGRSLAFQSIAETGEFLGVKVIRVGRRIFIPAAALDRVLEGVTDEK